MMKVHYAVDIIVNAACGIAFCNERKCPQCKSLLCTIPIETTFNKSKVTCKNCKRTKVFKNGICSM